jgi:trk system potassium uptake protein TrkA
MQIVILGAGQVGSALAENLIKDGHEITIVDISADRLQYLQENLDLRTVQGHCSYPDILRKAGTQSADVLIAVTNNDEANMIACQIAYSLFHTATKIARIRSPHYLIRKELFKKDNVPIDVFISPEQLVTHQIEHLMEYPGALQVLDFAQGRVKMAAIKPYYGGTMLGKTLDEWYHNIQIPTRIVAIFRNGHSIPIQANTTIEIGDEIFFVASSEDIPGVMTALKRLPEPYKNVMIMGGGNIGLTLAAELESHYQIKLIEKNRERCDILAESLNQTIVLLGDGADRNLLINENIQNIDVFCAATNDDEMNIIAAMQAKRLGVKIALPVVNRTAYVDLIEGNDIHMAISPQQVTVGAILTHIRKGDVEKVYSLRHGATEAIEAVAQGDKETSKVIGRKLSDIKLPENTIIGAIAREEEVIIPSNHTEIQAKDHIILFVGDTKQIPKVEKLFQVSAAFF